MHAALAHIRAQLTAALEELEDLERSIAHVPQALRHQDALSPDVPPGFETILGYLAKHQPEILDEIDYSKPEVTARDGWWASHQARRIGRKPVLVSAPPCLQRQNISHVNAWPVSILERRWS